MKTHTGVTHHSKSKLDVGQMRAIAISFPSLYFDNGERYKTATNSGEFIHQLLILVITWAS